MAPFASRGDVGTGTTDKGCGGEGAAEDRDAASPFSSPGAATGVSYHQQPHHSARVTEGQEHVQTPSETFLAGGCGPRAGSARCHPGPTVQTRKTETRVGGDLSVVTRPLGT